MSSPKLAVRLIATMILLSTGFVLYPQDSANAAKFCAQLRGTTATGHLDCSFSMLDCLSRARKGQGRRPLLQIALGPAYGEAAENFVRARRRVWKHR
jgi:hypothetical protein